MSFRDFGAGPGARGQPTSTGSSFAYASGGTGAGRAREGLTSQRGGTFGSAGALRTGGVGISSSNGPPSALHHGGLGQQRNMGGRPLGAAGGAGVNSPGGEKIGDYLMMYSVSVFRGLGCCYFETVLRRFLSPKHRRRVSRGVLLG